MADVPPLDFRATVPELIRRVVDRYGDRDFLISPDARLSYSDADRRSRMLAKQLLARGCGKGTRIGFILGNTPEWVVTWLAIARLGAIAMALSTMYRPAELLQVLSLADAETLIVPATLAGRDNSSYLEATLPG